MRIGEVAQATGVTAKTLRFYEAEGLLHEPARTASGYRNYGAEVVDRVEFIRLAQTAGLTLAQIRQVLAVRDDGQAPCAHVARFVDQQLAEVEARLAELRRVRRQLLALQERLAVLDPADCPPGDFCTAVQTTAR